MDKERAGITVRVQPNASQNEILRIKDGVLPMRKSIFLHRLSALGFIQGWLYLRMFS